MPVSAEARDTRGPTLGFWVKHLTVDAADTVSPTSSNQLLEEARQHLGQNAVDWAVRLAYDNARHLVKAIPQLHGGPGQPLAVRLGTELVALQTLLELLGVPRLSQMDSAVGDVISDFVHRRVEVEHIWSGMRASHAWMLQRLFQACRENAPVEQQAAELERVASTVLHVFNALTECSNRQYVEENRRWLSSQLAIQSEVVHSLLQGRAEQDLEQASQQLRYELLGRYHLSVIAWHTGETEGTFDDLTKAVHTWLEASGAQQSLLVPQGKSVVWAWGSDSRPLSEPDPADVVLPEGIRLATGYASRDVVGFRRSHADARIAETLATSFRGITGQVVRYTDVSVLAVLLADKELATRFAAEQLGALNSSDPRIKELRRTLRLYLETRSPQAVARRMYVARNTVTYRLRQAEDLLGCRLTQHPLELLNALMIADAIDEELPSQPHQ